MEDLLQGKSGQVAVVGRFARRDNEAGDAPDWGEPREVTLNIKRREKSLPRAKWRGQFAGDVLTMYIEDFEWAEYGQADYGGDNEWLAEEYCMGILEVRDNT